MVRLYECVIPKFLTGICKADSNQLYAAEKQWNLSSSPERTTLLGNEAGNEKLMRKSVRSLKQFRIQKERFKI